MGADVQHVSSGDQASGTRVWRRYWPRMRALARRLLNHRDRAVDEEDVAAAAMASYLRWRTQSRFPGSRLWPLLAKFTRFKATNLARRERRLKRRARPLLASAPSARASCAWTEVIAARVADSSEAMEEQLDLSLLLGGLDNELQEIARLRMEGYTQLEIAERTGRSLPTVERRLRLLKRILVKDRLS